MGKNMAIRLNPCCSGGHTVDFKLLLWADIISSNSACSSKAKLCQSPIHVLTFFFFLNWGVYSKHLAKQEKRSVILPIIWNNNADTSTPAWQSITGDIQVMVSIAYMLYGIESIRSADTVCHTHCRYTHLVQDAAFSSLPISTFYMTDSFRKFGPVKTK